jgi:hypothetical protein
VKILSRLFRPAATLLVPVLLSNSLVFAAKKPADPAVMKAKIQARGVGQGVRVTLADRTEVKGLIVSVGEQSFAVKAEKADKPQEIEYAQLTGVHNDKPTRGQTVGIVVAVVAVWIIVIAVVVTKEFKKGGYF